MGINGALHLTRQELIAGLQDLAAEAKTMVDADSDYNGTFQRDYDVCTQAAELIQTTTQALQQQP